jgi:hypothetical protein
MLAPVNTGVSSSDETGIDGMDEKSRSTKGDKIFEHDIVDANAPGSAIRSGLSHWLLLCYT